MGERGPLPNPNARRRNKRASQGRIVVKRPAMPRTLSTEAKKEWRRIVPELEHMGYEIIPSETNFFMMKTGRPVREVRAQFRERGVAVGRPFPPMLDYLRVSIGNENEMARFMTAFREIFT